MWDDFLESFLAEAARGTVEGDPAQGRVILKLTSGRTLYGTVQYVEQGFVALDQTSRRDVVDFPVYVRLRAIESVQYAEDDRDGGTW